MQVNLILKATSEVHIELQFQFIMLGIADDGMVLARRVLCYIICYLVALPATVIFASIYA